MNFANYLKWHALAPSTRPDIYQADGFLSGAIISLEPLTDDKWIEALIGGSHAQLESNSIEALAAIDLQGRLTELRTQFAEHRSHHAPILPVDPAGEFDLSAWSSGFLAAIGADIEIWAYLLAGQPEGGRFALISSHAAGRAGNAVRSSMTSHPQGEELQFLADTAWSMISPLLRCLYEKREELLAAGPGT